MRHKYLILGIISIIIFTITTLLASNLFGFGGHNLKFSITLILYCFVTFYSLKLINFKRHQILRLLFIALPPILIMGITYLRSIYEGNFQQTATSWLSSFSYIIGIASGFILYKAKRLYLIFGIIIMISLATWMYMYGYKCYTNYLNFRSFTGLVHEKVPVFKFTDKNSNIFQNSDFKNRIVIFDFWFTSCGHCINDMPRFENLFQKYGRDGKLLFYSINYPTSHDTIGYVEYMIRNYGFSFPLLISDSVSIKNFCIRLFPTYIVIKNNNIIFRGGMDNLQELIENGAI